MREDGNYWVKQGHEMPWEIALWRDNIWHLGFCNVRVTMPVVNDNRILTPDERKV